MSGHSPAEQVRAALGGVWDRAYPVVLGRVGAIESATAELAKQHPQAEPIDTGRAEAHKLAGVLGTFGLNRGTELARTLERLLHSHSTAEEAVEAEGMVTELRSAIEHARVG